MTRHVAFLAFDGVEDLDLVGPWQVMTTAAAETGALTCSIVAEVPRIIRCSKGLRIQPDHGFDDVPAIDVLVVPGGRGVDTERSNRRLVRWIDEVAAGCEWVTSVCSGALLLVEAGPARGRRITSHWGRLDGLRADGRAGEIVADVRYVRDGNVVTSAGVSAGIDMALWLVGQLFDPDLARSVQRRMQYDPAPPYANPSG